MDEEDDHELQFREAQAAPIIVSLAPFSPIPRSSRRRLSSSFVHRSPPVSPATPLAWVSLQGRLVNSEEASSIKTIGGGLSPDQALAWELFSPVHRFLIVAVIGVAVAESQKNLLIQQLKKSVDLRDQVLSSMQQKLDDLCQQVNYTKEHSIAETNKSLKKNGELPLNEASRYEKSQLADSGCWLCDQHCDLFNGLMGNSVTRLSSGNEVLYKMPFSNEEQEERRMSDLSWASNVTSAADIQLNSLAVEQDFYNLKRDCEEKDTKIKELNILLSSSEVAKSKRVSELEDIIRRKNSTITRLKKEMVVLEQKVMQLSRLRRRSFSGSDSHDDQLAHVRDNLIYDMESSTSPSSSDSDSTPLSSKDSASKLDDVHVLNQSSASASNQKYTPAKPISSSGRVLEQHQKSRSVSPLQEISANRKFNTASSSGQKQFSARENMKNSRRRPLSSGIKNASAHKGWVR